MPGLRRLTIALLSLAHLAAAALPCPPVAAASAGAGRERARPVASEASRHGGGEHGHRHDAGQASHRPGEVAHAAGHGRDESAHAGSGGHDDGEDCHAGASLIARCPCGCDERDDAQVPGSRLGSALLSAPIAKVRAVRLAAPVAAAPGAPRVTADVPDKIPLRLLS